MIRHHQREEHQREERLAEREVDASESIRGQRAGHHRSCNARHRDERRVQEDPHERHASNALPGPHVVFEGEVATGPDGIVVDGDIWPEGRPEHPQKRVEHDGCHRDEQNVLEEWVGEEPSRRLPPWRGAPDPWSHLPDRSRSCLFPVVDEATRSDRQQKGRECDCQNEHPTKRRGIAEVKMNESLLIDVEREEERGIRWPT